MDHHHGYKEFCQGLYEFNGDGLCTWLREDQYLAGGGRAIIAVRRNISHRRSLAHKQFSWNVVIRKPEPFYIQFKEIGNG